MKFIIEGANPDPEPVLEAQLRINNDGELVLQMRRANVPLAAWYDVIKVDDRGIYRVAWCKGLGLPVSEVDDCRVVDRSR